MRDDEAASCLNGGACEVVVGLEGFDGDLKALGDLLKGVAHADTIPMSGLRLAPDLSNLDWDWERRELVGRGSIQQLFHSFPGAHGDL